MKSSLGMIARNWWPVAVWLGVIRLESTGYASSQNTFRLLYQTLSFFGRVNPMLVFEMDHALRKSGHFIGYAVLSGLTFLALRNTYRDRIQSSSQRPWGKSIGDLWRVEWSLIAILLTVVTASMDEIHQTFLPFRTGRWQDVVLDTSGAFVLQLLIYFACQLRVSSRNGATLPPPKLPLAESD